MRQMWLPTIAYIWGSLWFAKLSERLRESTLRFDVAHDCPEEADNAQQKAKDDGEVFWKSYRGHSIHYTIPSHEAKAIDQCSPKADDQQHQADESHPGQHRPPPSASPHRPPSPPHPPQSSLPPATPISTISTKNIYSVDIMSVHPKFYRRCLRRSPSSASPGEAIGALDGFRWRAVLVKYV